MVSGAAVLFGHELVDEVITGSDRTLRDAIDAVHVHGLVLSNALEPPIQIRASQNLSDSLIVYIGARKSSV